MAYPAVTVTGDPVPSDRRVSIAVEVVEQFTVSSPAELRIEFANEASESREFLFKSVSPFDRLVGRADAGKEVHAIPYDDDNPDAGPYSRIVPRSPVEGCWKLTDSWTVGFGLRWPAEPGATTSMTYVILDDPETADCLPPGRYRFEDEWGELLPDDGDVWHPWGFTAELRL